MSYVNIPVGRTQDTVDFRVGNVPGFDSLDGRGQVVNQTLGFLTNARIVANYEIALMRDNLLDSITKGHYLFTLSSTGPLKRSTTLLNLPLLNYVLAEYQSKNTGKDKDWEMWVYQNVKPVGVLVSEDSEWKAEPSRNKYMRQRQVVVGVSGMVTDVYNVWGKPVKTGTKLYFKIDKIKSDDCRYKLHKQRSIDTVVPRDNINEIFQVVPYAHYRYDGLENRDEKSFRSPSSSNLKWYVGKAATGARPHELTSDLSRNVDKINNCSKIECFMDF